MPNAYWISTYRSVSDADKLAARFSFPLDQKPGEIINLLFAKAAPIWLKGDPAPSLKLDRLEAVTGSRD